MRAFRTQIRWMRHIKTCWLVLAFASAIWPVAWLVFATLALTVILICMLVDRWLHA